MSDRPHQKRTTPTRTTTARRDFLARTLPSATLGATGVYLLTAAVAPGRALARAIRTPVTMTLPLTPPMTEGPFYPEAFDPAPTTTLRRAGLTATARPMILAGRVLDTAGQALGGARIEIWQCDAYSRYHHSRDSEPDARDPGFLGYGWQLTGADGGYRFETIRPVAYPGRTPHIHVVVRQGEQRLLTSQVFMPDEAAANDADGLFGSLRADARPNVTATLRTPSGETELLARFDLVVARIRA